MHGKLIKIISMHGKMQVLIHKLYEETLQNKYFSSISIKMHRQARYICVIIHYSNKTK